MMTFGKTEVRKVMDVLDAEHETVGEAARACLEVMRGIYEARSRFALVGQLMRTPERHEIPPDDPEAIKMCLGFFSTESEARVAAEQLFYNPRSHMEWRAWVLDVWHGTPAELHAEQRDIYKAKQQARRDKARTKLQAQIEKRTAEAEQRAQSMRENAA